MTRYMVKCDECKRIVRYTKNIQESYAGATCPACQTQTRGADILDKLAGLLKQATTEHSHYYVAAVCAEASNTIATLRRQLSTKKKGRQP